MSYAEIKKAVNSDLETPLNETLGKKADAAGTTAASSLFSWVKGIFSALSTVQSNVTTINTNTARGAVKSIQKGYHKGVWAAGPPDIAITIASVTPAKCMVLLNSSRSSGTSTYPSVYTPALKSLTATTLTVTGSMYGAWGSNGGEVGFSWQVIEFY